MLSEAELRAGLYINDVGKSWLFFAKAGLTDKQMADLKLKVDGDLGRFRDMIMLQLKISKNEDAIADAHRGYANHYSPHGGGGCDEYYIGDWSGEYDSEGHYGGYYENQDDSWYPDWNENSWYDDWCGYGQWDDWSYEDYYGDDWWWYDESGQNPEHEDFWGGKGKKGKGKGKWKGGSKGGKQPEGQQCTNCGSKWHSGDQCPMPKDKDKKDQKEGEKGSTMAAEQGADQTADGHYWGSWNSKGKKGKYGKGKFGKFGKGKKGKFGKGKGFGKSPWGKSQGKFGGKGYFSDGAYGYPNNFEGFVPCYDEGYRQAVSGGTILTFQDSPQRPTFSTPTTPQASLGITSPVSNHSPQDVAFWAEPASSWATTNSWSFAEKSDPFSPAATPSPQRNSSSSNFLNSVAEHDDLVPRYDLDSSLNNTIGFGSPERAAPRTAPTVVPASVERASK